MDYVRGSVNHMGSLSNDIITRQNKKFVPISCLVGVNLELNLEKMNRYNTLAPIQY